MNPINACIFDVDGTLLVTSEFIYSAFEHVLGAHGYEVPPRDILIAKTGKRLGTDYEALTGLTDTEELCREHRLFQNKRQDLVTLFPHVKETLLKLKEKGIRIAATTIRSKITSVASLQGCGIYEVFDKILYAEDSKPKPDPDSVLQCLAYFKTLPKNCYVIGDRESDIEAGKNAGTQTVGVTYGHLGKDIIKSSPTHVIDDIQELLSLIERQSA